MENIESEFEKRVEIYKNLTRTVDKTILNVIQNFLLDFFKEVILDNPQYFKRWLELQLPFIKKNMFGLDLFNFSWGDEEMLIEFSNKFNAYLEENKLDFTNLVPLPKFTSLKDLKITFNPESKEDYNLFKDLWIKDQHVQHTSNALNFTKEGLEFTNNHCAVLIEAQFMKDKPEMRENKGWETGFYKIGKDLMGPTFTEITDSKYPDIWKVVKSQNIASQLESSEKFTINRDQLLLLIRSLETIQFLKIPTGSTQEISIKFGEKIKTYNIIFLLPILKIFYRLGHKQMEFLVEERFIIETKTDAFGTQETKTIFHAPLKFSPNLEHHFNNKGTGALIMPRKDFRPLFVVNIENQKIEILKFD